MSSIENYEGLCGQIHLHSSSDQRVRCNYEFAHSGPHSWEKKKFGLSIMGGAILNDYADAVYNQKRWIPANEGRKKIVIGKPDMSD